MSHGETPKKGIVMRIIVCIKIGILMLILSSMGCATSGGEENVASSVDSGLAAVEQAAQGGRQAIESGTTAAKNMETGQADLADILVNQLGVSNQQAMGGAGAIFQEARTNMKPQDFTTLSQSVPGMSDMLKAAPKVSGSAPGMAGGLSSMMGDANNALGSMASLASSFQQLNLSPDMVSQFVPVVTNYVRNTGGQAVANLLQSALGTP
ncbi:hypothetical protein Noc_1094 [Nitrosococcus oceani ATCC 19707]|uniref:DUF2780 domain-containing protein n=2 Tax=Nitrosococcus oceani TaxID=1229 RepID=Q3JC47_NITOC|nr:DUF2780 domain-containing protein [Nitrosococcus oceani]ABA57599.1 hypothetical protein Noc_1094 [Nitrosococcus oceani ATCC 19707]EDZ67701.1 hypothetical protein NOC27_1028 [Nitrosococcus oceani AFC27]